METFSSIRKYSGIFLLLGALTVSLTGCFTNLQDIFGTPTPSPTPNPDVVIDPEIDLNPIGGHAGTLVEVVGEGWRPGKLVILKLEDEEGRSGILAANIPDSEGIFQASFNYPRRSRWLRPGFTQVVAYALNEDIETTAQFVVIEPTPANSSTPTEIPTEIPTGTSATIPTNTPMDTPTNSPTNTPTLTSTNTPTTIVEATPLETSTGTSTSTPTGTPVAVNVATATSTDTPFAFLLLPTASNTPIQIPTVTPTPEPPTLTPTQQTATQPAPTEAVPPTDSQVPTPPAPEADGNEAGEQDADGESIVVSSEQITTPVSDELPAVDNTAVDATTDDAADDGTDGQSGTLTPIVVSIAPTSTVSTITDAGAGSGTSEPLRPFPEAAEPTATSGTPTVTPTWTPLPEVVVIQEWRGDYWNNPDMTGPPQVIRNDRTIDFYWGSSAPSSELPSDNFSARWSRTLAFESGIYTFYMEVDDGGRLYVDGQLLIDSWEDRSRRTLTAQKVLSEGQHQVIVEYYEKDGNAVARLGWEGSSTFRGWKGEYFANKGLNGQPTLVRDDSEINFEWGVDSPAPTLPEDGFSVRWQRRIAFDSGTYRFTASADDGIRVWIDDELIIDEWRDQSEEAFSAELNLLEGSHELRIEYYENTLGAVARFEWEEITASTLAPTLVPTPTWTPALTPVPPPTPTWTPEALVPTPTWTPQR